MNIENFAVLSAYLVGLLHLVAFFIYGKKILEGWIRPNATTWTIWAIGSILTLVSYEGIAQDWVKEVIALTDVIGCLVIFGIALYKGSFERPDRTDMVILVCDVTAIAIWMAYDSVLLVYLILQASSTSSIIPSCRSVAKDPGAELPALKCWYIWGLSYVLAAVVVVMRDGGWQELLYPINYAAMHFAVGITTSVYAKRHKIQAA